MLLPLPCASYSCCGSNYTQSLPTLLTHFPHLVLVNAITISVILLLILILILFLHRRRRLPAAPFCAKMFNFFATVKIFGWLTQPISNEQPSRCVGAFFSGWYTWLVGICTTRLYIYTYIHVIHKYIVVVVGLLSTTVDYELCVACFMAWFPVISGLVNSGQRLTHFSPTSSSRTLTDGFLFPPPSVHISVKT